MNKILLVVLLYIVSAWGDIITETMKTVPNYERGYKLQYNESTTTYVASRIACVKDCIANNTCNSVNVKKENNKVLCESSTETATGSQSFILDPDYKHFVKYTECLNGGTWNATISACQDCQYLTRGKACDTYIKDCDEGKDLFGLTVTTKALIKPVASDAPFFVECSKWCTFIAGREFRSDMNFNRSWQEFKVGFGDFDYNFFVGLENLHKLTNQKKYRCEIYLTDGIENIGARYTDFKIKSEQENYYFNYSTFSANPDRTLPADNGFQFGPLSEQIRGSPFCTYDHDCGMCAKSSSSGWWFNTDCTDVNLHRFQINTFFKWPVNGSLFNFKYYDFCLTPMA